MLIFWSSYLSKQSSKLAVMRPPEGYVFALMLPLITALSFYFIIPIRGDMCSAMVTAKDGDNLTSLRDRAFLAFRGACRQNKLCTFFTEPQTLHSFKFILKPLSMPFRLEFTVKANRHAMIALAENKTEESIFAEISIGGWSNTKSVIRPCHSDVCDADRFAIHDEEGLHDGNEYRPFWIEYKEGIVTVGKGGQATGFMEWDAGKYHQRVPSEVQVGISTWEDEYGSWVFNKFCE